MRTYFTFVFDYPQAFDNTTRWTPEMNLFQKYPHMEGILSIKCDIAGDDKTKELPNGKKWGYRLGYFEADDATLASFGTSVADIIAKAKSVLSQYEITELTKVEVAEYLRKWTTLTEETQGKFLLNPEYLDPMTNETVPAEYVDLTPLYAEFS